MLGETFVCIQFWLMAAGKSIIDTSLNDGDLSNSIIPNIANIFVFLLCAKHCSQHFHVLINLIATTNLQNIYH